MSLRLSPDWRPSPSGLQSRSYDDYETYREHQRLKLDAHRAKSIRRHDARFFAALRDEVRRVLTASGLLICEVGLGTDSASPGFYESLAWKNVDELAEHIRKIGFDLVGRANFEVPWTGQQLVLRKNSAAAASNMRESSVVHSAG
jgi:hypothetical protein